MLSLRRIGGRMVIAAAVAAVAILVFRDQGGDRGPVRWTIDPRPLGAEVRAIDVTLAVGDRVLAWQHRDGGTTPLTLSTPAPGGAVTITVDVVLPDGPRRIVKTASPGAGAVVEVRLGE
ncbi:MAG: hypothetical protein JNK64_07115 [Myxococcales bacterium]|nr:hypothetical protein [Myxococcales bacterium]